MRLKVHFQKNAGPVARGAIERSGRNGAMGRIDIGPEAAVIRRERFDGLPATQKQRVNVTCLIGK